MTLVRKHAAFLAIFLTSAYMMFARLGRDLLWDWDECLYSQYAKEMKASGHFISNIWNGYLDFQKPPLYSWLLQIPTAIFGRSEFSLRFLSVVAALGILIVLYLFTQKYFSKTIALISVLVVLTGEVFVIYSMKMNTDMVYVLFILCAVWAWFQSYTKDTLSYVAGLLFGLAMMVKGIGSVQFMGTLLFTVLLNPSKERFFNYIKMVSTCLLVVLPWHIVMYMIYGQKYIQVYFWENIVRRSQFPIEFHRERWWYYFLLIYRELKPWVVISFLGVLSITSLRTFKSLKKHEYILTILLLIVLPLISITKVHTRIAWYILPLYPFIAIWIAYSLNLMIEFIERKTQNVPALPAGRNLKKLFLLIIICGLIYDSGRLFLNEVKFTKTKGEVSPRNEVALKIKNQPEKELHYLVSFGERQAKEILPPEEQIDMTFVYGGNACMVYYSDKKVHYFYSVDAFTNKLSNRGLFLLENGDLKLIEGMKKKIIFQNSDFTVFRNQ